MTLVTHLQRQFEYEFWAGGEEVRVLSGLPDPPSSAVRLLAHLIGGQMLWLDRLQGQPSRITVWPDLSLTDCVAKLKESKAGWRSYVDGLSDNALTACCHYTNSKGEVWENSVLDILSHVLLHSAYHRGQIALEIRRSGQTPGYTDYIHAVRQELLR